MTQPETPRCSCIIGRTLAPDRLHALDAALRAGEPIRELGRVYNVKRSPLGRHKLGCLRAGGTDRGQDGGQGGTEATAPPGDRDEAPRARVPTGQTGAGDVPGTERDNGSFREHVRELAGAIVRFEWKGRRSVTSYSERWGLSREAVRERYRAASAIAGLDRGDLAEALEVALGEAVRAAEHCGQKAAELEEAADVDSVMLAIKYRALEKGWTEKRWQLEGLLVSRVSVSLEADPRIVGMMRALWTALGEVDASLQEQRQVHEQRVRSFIAAVEKITGGPLPEEVLALVAGGESIPSVADTVDLAVKRYEEQTGGRAPGRLEA